MTGQDLDRQIAAWRHSSTHWYEKSMTMRSRLYDILDVVRKNENELSDTEALAQIRELVQDIP